MRVGETIRDLTGVKGKIAAIDVEQGTALVRWFHHERSTWIEMRFLKPANPDATAWRIITEPE